MASITTSNRVKKSLSILQIDSRGDAELALLELSRAEFEVESDVIDSLSELAGRISNKSYDVVLAECHLPGWAGTDALRIVRQYHPDLPFILVTGNLGDEQAAECLKRGVSDVVLKDSLARLPFVVQRALEEKSLREERELARQALEESEGRFRKLVEASPDAIFVHCEGEIVFANPATLKLLGAETPEQIIGKNALDIVHPDCLSAVLRQLETDYRIRAISPALESVFIRLDGTSVEVEAIGIPISWHGAPAIEVVARNITERKHAAKQIAHLASFPEFNPASVFETDLEGKLTYANPAALRRFPDLLQSGLTHALLKDWVSCIEIFKKDSKQQVTREIETNGSGFLQTFYLTHELGMVRAYLVDITERKRAEEQKRVSEKVVLEWKQRLLLAESAALPIGMWEWNLSNDTLVWSDEIYRQCGYTRDNFHGTAKEFRERIYPEDSSAVENAVQAVASGISETYEIQFRILRPNGTIRWLDSRGVMASDGSRRMIGISIDITKLRRSEADYRSIIEASPIGVFRSDNGHFLMANPTLVNILGYDSESELLALDIGSDVYSDSHERDRLVALLIESGYLKDVEADWKQKDGHIITVRINAAVVRQENGETGFQGFVSDITESKTLAKQLWLSQKMEAIGRLAGGVAHDFNNVLMIVSTYADLIMQREGVEDKVHYYANKIRESSARAVSITRQLLAFSRQQMLEPQVLNLNTVVVELGKVLPRLLGEDIEVVTILEAALSRLKVDRGQLEQVLMNLAVNSRDAMPSGGRFEIKTQNVELDRAYAAEHPPMIPGNYIKLTISDTGIGMDAETQARLFEPFFTTKERGKGTGLGLATVYGIVKQSGGFIWSTSDVGCGTTFEIYFPPVAEQLTKHAEPSATATTSKGSETILLVEDEALLRESICEFLQLDGYTVLAASGGAEAERICEQHVGKIDVILTDLVMPGIDGVGVANAVALRYPGITIMYMTGYTDRASELLDAGAVLLRKPFSLSELANKLHSQPWRT